MVLLMRNCFVCGCPRSGTTVITEILNENPSVAIGIERYKYIAMGARGREFTPDLFEIERFMDVRETDTNLIRPNEALKRKFAEGRTVSVIGDKIPRLYTRLGFLRETFPQSKMVYIIREPLTVAHSWERRAKNPKDTWPEANGAERGIEEWVRSLDIISAAAPAWGDALVVVDYDRFFDCSTVEEFRLNIARLYRTLDLPVSRTITERAAQRNFREKSAEHRDPTNLPYYAQAIAAQANPKLAPLLARAI